MLIPAPIPDSAIAEIRRLAAAAFDAVSCEGLARVDFFYTSSGQVLVNEINTMPGLSPTSYFQKMWEASGLAVPAARRQAAADRPEEAAGPALARRRSRAAAGSSRSAAPRWRSGSTPGGTGTPSTGWSRCRMAIGSPSLVRALH